MFTLPQLFKTFVYITSHCSQISKDKIWMVIAINVHIDGNILGILPLLCTLMTINIVINMHINDNITEIDLRVELRV